MKKVIRENGFYWVIHIVSVEIGYYSSRGIRSSWSLTGDDEFYSDSEMKWIDKPENKLPEPTF
jgi:hypothetical protein